MFPVNSWTRSGFDLGGPEVVERLRRVKRAYAEPDVPSHWLAETFLTHCVVFQRRLEFFVTHLNIYCQPN